MGLQLFNKDSGIFIFKLFYFFKIFNKKNFHFFLNFKKTLKNILKIFLLSLNSLSENKNKNKMT